MKTLRLKVKPGSAKWLNAAAIEVNQVWNWVNERSCSIFRNTGKRMSGFDLCNSTAGSTAYFDKIGSDTINKVCTEYANKRCASKKARLSWRKSAGTRRSLGWVPFKGSAVKRNGNALRFLGKNFRVFNREYLANHKLHDGCFAEDSLGQWWICIPISIQSEEAVAPNESVGIDLGLKTIATTSEGETLEAGRWTHRFAQALANAQRRGHHKQAKRIHRKLARCRADALHKFSRKIVDRYQNIIVGDVSSTKLAKTRMAKSVLDSGWGMLKTQLTYKGEHAGRCVQIVNESYTSITCSSCGSLSGPRGVNGLTVRRWDCGDCGESHERDVNAARNILRRAELPASVCGNRPAAGVPTATCSLINDELKRSPIPAAPKES